MIGVLSPIKQMFVIGVDTYRRNKRLVLKTVPGLSGVVILLVIAFFVAEEEGLTTQFGSRNQSPTLEHFFGTDWMGRDLFSRVFLGLRLSFCIGLVSALVSTVIGVLLGVVSGALGGLVERLVIWLVDLVMSLPHLVFQILIAFVIGGGIPGVVLAISFTHWATTTRIIRAEVMRLRTAEYVKLSEKFGRSKIWIVRHHMLPQVLPQFLVAMILMFPHAIAHEAALSFIGVGLSPHVPSMGVIFSDSMRGLSAGYWWLLVFPGVALLLLVKCFDRLGETIRDGLTPRLGLRT